MPGTAKAIEVVTSVEKQPDGTIVVGKVTLLLKDDGAVSQVSEYVNWSKLGE